MRELDLSENRIHRFENLHKLTLLESLNLSGNSIKDLPKAAIEPLKCLKSLKISKNKIGSLQEIGNLSILPSLENLFVAGNQVCEIEEYQLFIVYCLASLESLDGNIVTSQFRLKASKKHAGPSPETWVIRENLVSFRRTLGEKNLEKQEFMEKLSSLQGEIDKMRGQVESTDKKIEKNKTEIENIENALLNTGESEDVKKKYMRDLLTKTENLRDSSVNLQERMSYERTVLQGKTESFDAATRQLSECKNSEKERILEMKSKLSLEINEIEENIEELEAQYGVVLEELNLANTAITKVEEEILLIRGSFNNSLSSKNKTRGSHKRESSFTMDNDTKLYLTSRKEEIIQEMPELKLRRKHLLREIELLVSKQEAMQITFRDLEREILEISRQTNDCEEFLQRANTPSPLRSRANTKLMWDSVKGLWQLLTDNPWEYESDDIQKGIIRWAEHMKEHINRKKIDHEEYLELLAQGRIDQENINHLTLKVQELNEQLLSKTRLNDEIDKLHARIDAFREKEKIWTNEKSDLIKRLKDAENMLDLSERRVKEFNKEDLKIGSETLETLRHEKVVVEESIRVMSENAENLESEVKGRIGKLNGYCSKKAEELHELDGKVQEKVKELKEFSDEVLWLQRSKEEVSRTLEGLNENKRILEKDYLKMKEEGKAMRSLKVVEEERDKLWSVVKSIGTSIGVNGLSEDFKGFVRAFEEKYEKVREDLEKAEKFKVNKLKFIDMYESNTKELQDEWSVLKTAKEELETEKSRINSIKLDKKNLDEQMKQLISTTKDLQRLKNNLEKETIKQEEHLNSLKQSTSTFESLKQKELHEYNRVQSLHEDEMKKLEENMQDLKVLKSQIKDSKLEKNSLEEVLSSSKSQISRLTEKKQNLEEDIRENEGILYKIANKLTEEQIKVQKEVDKVRMHTEEKEKELQKYENLIHNYEHQAGRMQRECTETTEKLSAISEELHIKESLLKEQKMALHEIESKQQLSESTLERAKKESELLTQTFTSKRQKISEIELEIAEKTCEIEKIQKKHEQSAAEFQVVEKQIQRIKSDLQGIEVVINKKNSDYEEISRQIRMKTSEIRDVEKELGEKYMALSKAEQQFSDIHTQARSEEETIQIFREEAKNLQVKIAKLSETLRKVESQKHQVLQEIDDINVRVTGEELRHRKEMENLRNAVGNGESTLRQLMESVQRCRNKLAADKEESGRLADEINLLVQQREEFEEVNRELHEVNLKLSEEVAKLKVEEDTAIVLLALSGHRIDEKIKERITSLCKAASELEKIKARDTRYLESRDSVSETRLRAPSRIESYENTSIYEKGQKELAELHGESQSFEAVMQKTPPPEMNDMQKLLHTLEVTQQRLRSLTPINELSFER